MAMTCDEARERLSALLDEALGPDERGPLEAHLAACPDCRRELGLLRNTVALLRGVEPARAPAGFVDRVLASARLVPRRRGAPALPWPVKLPLAAAAAVLVGVTVAHLLRMTPELQHAARIEPPSPAVTEAPRPQEPPATPGGSPGPKAKAEPVPATRERREGRAKDLADAATSQRSALRATAADVSGRLVVPDREAAARALTELVAKAGGAEVTRSAAPDAMVIEVRIPRTAWAEFTREVAALGTWTP